MRNRSHKRVRRGATTLQMLVILVPALFGFMGFAVDLGRLYMIRGELKSAADAMALAAAQQLIGTGDADARATEAMEAARTNRYDYGGMPVGETTGNFTSTVESVFAGDVATATGQDGAIPIDTTQNRYARITLTADAPLVFFRLFAIAQEGRTPIRTQSVAGVSAPLCTACGIEPIVISALDPDEPEDFGFVTDNRYTLGYVCTGPNQPQPLAGGTARIPFLLLDRFTNVTTGTPEAEAVRAGAGGLPSALGCVRASFLSATEEAALFVQPLACAPPANVAQLSATVRPFVCGLSARVVEGGADGCEAADVAGNAPGFQADTFLDVIDEYSGYTGNTRRIVTAAIIRESVAGAPSTVEVLGFRQFLLDPNLLPSDQNVRFNALYLGYPMPLRQGSVSAAADENGNTCSVATGPGKVVLHQ